MTALAGLRATARIEWRQLGRSRRRSALVGLLIAIPVAVLVCGSVLLRIAIRTDAEQVAHVLGAADLRIDAGGDRARWPAGARVDSVTVRSDLLERGGLRLAVLQCAFDPRGLAAPMFEIVRGRAPRSADEVAVAPVVAAAARAVIGDRAKLASDGRRVTIVGLVVDPEDLGRPLVTVPAGAGSTPGGTAFDLVALPVGSDPEAVAARLRASAAAVVRTRDDAVLPFGDAGRLAFGFGALGFVEVALVIAAAFAVGLRRRQREVGLELAAGASPRDVIVAILIAAAALAIAGGVVGAACGVGAAALLHGHLDEWTGRMTGPFEVPVGGVLAAVAFGVATAVAAAVLPARRAIRLPLRFALSGRRPQARPARSWAVVGVALVAFALLVMFACHGRAAGGLALVGAIVSSVAGVLGFGACSPWLLDRCARAASRLPLTWRLAVRDAGRHRGRHGPVVAAVSSSMALAVTLAAFLASFGELERGGWIELRDDQLRIDGPAAAEVGARIAAARAVVARAPLRAAWDDGAPIRARVRGTVGGGGWVAVGDGELLASLGVDRELAAAAGTLTSIVAPLGGRPVELVRARDGSYLTDLAPIDAPIDTRIPDLAFVISDDELDRLDLRSGPPPGRETAPWIVRLAGPVDDAVLAQARAIAERFAGTSIEASLLHRRGPRMLLLAAFALSVLTGLLVLGASTALTAEESRADRATLAVVGASPLVGRAHAAAQAAWLALLGCVLGVPAGLLPVFGALPSGGELRFVVPWAAVTAALALLPVLAYVGAFVMTRPVALRSRGA